MWTLIAWCFALPIGLLVAGWVLYPALVWLAARLRPAPAPLADPPDWPAVTVIIPCYNEAASIGHTLDRLLALDYPADRLHVLAVSDASTDGTDDIVRRYADRQVRLLRMPERGGKSVAENAAARLVTTDVVVNIDATIVLHRDCLRWLMRAMADPTVGVASARDVSVGDTAREASSGESGYVGYEMWLRQQETRLGTIIGASGCCYAIRRHLIAQDFPAHLSRDFASPLIAREHGYRSVSVDGALCYVPRARSLKTEYRRKIRTMERGLRTLFFKAHLMNPFRYGRFAWMLIGHKLVRWSALLALPLLPLGVALAATRTPLAILPLVGGLAVLAAGIAALRWPDGRPVPRLVGLAGYLVAGASAGASAWVGAVGGRSKNAIWEPTRRPLAGAPPA